MLLQEQALLAASGRPLMHCHVHLMPRRQGNVAEPRGGVRGVIPEKQSARLNDLEPFAYLKGIQERMVQGHPINRIDDLLPWNYTGPLEPNPKLVE